MVTTPLDGHAAQHLDRIVGEILTSRDFDNAPVRLLAAADLGDLLERVR